MESFVAFICKRVLDAQPDDNLEFAQEDELRALRHHYQMNNVTVEPKPKSWFRGWF